MNAYIFCFNQINNFTKKVSVKNILFHYFRSNYSHNSHSTLGQIESNGNILRPPIIGLWILGTRNLESQVWGFKRKLKCKKIRNLSQNEFLKIANLEK